MLQPRLDRLAFDDLVPLVIKFDILRVRVDFADKLGVGAVG